MVLLATFFVTISHNRITFNRYRWIYEYCKTTQEERTEKSQLFLFDGKFDAFSKRRLDRLPDCQTKLCLIFTFNRRFTLRRIQYSLLVKNKNRNTSHLHSENQPSTWASLFYIQFRTTQINLNTELNPIRIVF